MTATKIAEVKNGNHGQQALYRMEPPHDGHEFVVVSAISNEFGTETYIFPADEDGEITDWCELPGSYKGGMDHEEALENAGYQVA